MEEAKTIGTTPVQDKTTQRIKSIDRFRGMCVFAMLFFQFLKEMPSLGFLSRIAQHNLEKGIVILPGMTLADIVAPSFIFAIGLTFALSFSKYKSIHGRKDAYIRYGLRGLSIIGVGTFLAVCNKVIDSMDGYKLTALDITVLVLASLTIALVLFKILCLSVPKLKGKVNKIATMLLYGILSILGLINLGIALTDFIVLVAKLNKPIMGYWVTLQNIGMACLVALPLVEAKNWVRLLVATVIFALYTTFHQIGDHQALLDVVVHGGFLGGFGWGAMLIFDLILADLFKKDKHDYISASAMFFALGVWAIYWFGNVNLGSCSPAFILVSVGLPALIFYLFHLTDKLPHCKFDPLMWWGKNPLVMFLVEFFIIGSYTSFAPDSLLKTAPLWLASVEAVVALVLLTTIAYLLNRLKKSISL